MASIGVDWISAGTENRRHASSRTKAATPNRSMALTAAARISIRRNPKVRPELAGLPATAIAASANFPALTLAIFWRGYTTAGAVTSMVAGTVLTLVLIYFLGLAVRSIIGRWALGLIDKLLLRLPLLKDLYQAWKQIAVTPGGSEGMYAITSLQ